MGGETCARPECANIQKEMKLLSAELDELEAENEELHEALDQLRSSAAKQPEKGTSKASRHQEAEIESLKDELNQYKAKLKESDTSVKSIKAEKVKYEQEMMKLQEENKSLQVEVEEKSQLLAKESRNAKRSESAAEQQSKEKRGTRDELIKVLKENEMLQEELQRNKDALDQVSSVAMEYETLLEQKKRTIEDLEMTMTDNQNSLRELEAQLNQAEQEKKTFQDKLLEMDEAESAVDALIDEHKKRYDKEKKALNLLLEKERQRVGELQESLKITRETSVVGNLEDKLADLEDLRRNDRTVILELRQQLEQREMDLESVMEQHVNIKEVVSRAVNDALADEKRLRTDLKDEIKSLKERLADQRALIRDFEHRYAVVESDLAEAEAWKSRYEAGAGLQDVIKFQKKLKADLKRRDADNIKLRDQLNDQIEACGKLNAACQRLKQELGKPIDFEFDDLELEDQMKGEAAAANAVIAQLEQQIDDLEEERVRLLHSLRNNAKLAASSGFKNFGLNPDQMILVNEFITNLKEGKADLRPTPLNPRTKTLQDEIDRLKLELARAESRADIFEEQLTGQPRRTASSPKKGGEDLVLKNLQQELKVMSEKQAAILENQQMLRVQSTDDSPNTPVVLSPTDTAPPTADEHLTATEKIIVHERVIERLASREQDMITPEAIAEATAAAVTDALTSAQRTILPMFESIDEVDEAAEANLKLQKALDELVKRDEDIGLLENAVRKYEAAIVTLNDQHTLLYRDYVIEQQKRENSLQQVRAELKDMTDQCNEYKIKALRLDELCNLTKAEQDPSDMNAKLVSEVRELSRKVAVFEVNECRLSRKYNLMSDQLESEINRREGVETDSIEMEKLLKLRIRYLETWKDGAEKTLSRMHVMLQKSLPKCEFDTAKHELLDLRESYLSLLHREAEIRAEWATTRELPTTVTALMHRIEILEQERESTKAILHVEETHDAQMQDVLSLKAEQLVECVSNYRKQVLKLQVEVAGSTKKVEVLQSRLRQVETELKKEICRCGELETRTHDAEKTIVEAQSRARDVLEKYEHGATQEEAKALNDRIEELELMYEKISREVEKHKEVADIAVAQAQAIGQRRDAYKIEIKTLKEQLEEFTTQSDDEAIIGRLQQKLMNIKANYQAFAQKYESVASVLRHKELQVKQLEVKLDEKEKSWSEQQEQTREQLAALEKAIWMIQYECGSTGGTSRVRLSNVKDLSDRVRDLVKNLDESGQQRVELEQKLAISADKIEGLKVKLAQLGGTVDEDDAEESSIRKLHQANAKVIDQMKEIEHLRSNERSLMDQLLAKGNQPIVASRNMDGDLMPRLRAAQERIIQLTSNISELKNQCMRLEQQLEDATGQIAERDRQLEWLRSSGSGGTENTNPNRVTYYEEDQKQLQIAAQVTVSSLKTIIEEKNKLLDDYKVKLEHLEKRNTAEREADLAEIARLNDKVYNDNQEDIQELRSAYEKLDQTENGNGGESASRLHETLMEQIKDAQGVIAERDEDIDKLRYQIQLLNNQRDTAEYRAGEALEELARVKDRFSQAEDELQQLKSDTRLEKLVSTLKSQMKQKEKKLSALREAVIKLKEEFIKAEERHAAELAREENRAADSQQNETRELEEKVTQLMNKNEMLQEKLQQTEEDLRDIKKKGQRGGGQVRELEQELEEANEKEAQLREKIKMLQHQRKTTPSDHRERAALEKQIKVLQAQNAALRDASEPNKKAAVAAVAAAPVATGSTTKAWEQEKRLRRRVEVLGQRLDEKNREVETLTAQLHQSRETLARVEKERDFYKIQGRSAGESSSSKRIAPNVGQKERELEAVVESMKLVIEKLRSENDRIKKHTPSATKFVEQGKRLKTMKQRIEELEAERMKSKHVSNAHEEVCRKLAQVQESNLQLKRQIRTREDELRQYRNEKPPPVDLTAELEQAKTRAGKLERRLERLEDEKQELEERIASEGGGSNAVSTLKGELRALKLEYTKLKTTQVDQDQLKVLQDENARLTKELSAFDLDFFEEVEDLKYKYAKAVEELQHYKRTTRTLEAAV